MTLLTMCQEAAVLCNLPQPTSIVNSTDPNTPILFALANQEGRELSRRHDWKILTLPDFTFTSVAAEEQTAFPAGFERLLPNPELWNQSSSQRYTGPVSVREWQELQSMPITAGSPGWWRLGWETTAPYGPTIFITPAPTAGETIAIPYINTDFSVASNLITGGSDAWHADTDVGLLPENVMVLGIIWRYKKTKGLDYAEDMATYEREVERACTRDRGANALKLRKYRADDFLWPTWPGTVVP